jgi:lysophospholipase L1-like esterase
MKSNGSMPRRWAASTGLLFLALAWGGGAAPAATRTNGPAGRIVFLGDSITYSGQYVEFLEAGLRLQWPKAEFEIISAGLPSETVSGLSEPGHAGGQFPRPDLHERLDRALAKTKPNLVIACYGMNDGIYHPFSEERFRRFQEGIGRLREKTAAAGAQIIHLTPPTFDPVPIQARLLPAGRDSYPQPYAGYNEVLDRYADWLLAQRAQGWVVVDIHGPMNRHLAEHRKQDPAYRLAGDGVHPNTTGHWLMARPLLLHFGVPADLAAADDAKQMTSTHPSGGELLALIQQRQRLLKDAWLTDIGHQRPGMSKGLALAEAQQRGAELDIQIRALLDPLPAPEIRRDRDGRITILTAATNAVTRYTLDGSDPGKESGSYLAPIDIPLGGRVKARTLSTNGVAKSAVATATFEAAGTAPSAAAHPHSALLPITQNRDWRVYDWAARHAAVVSLVRERKPGLVFIGDSITHFFGGEPRAPIARGEEVWQKSYTRRNAVNLGFGWDRTENVLWRLQHGELDGASPTAAVVLIGTNNLDVNTPDEIADGIRAICSVLHRRLPQTKILLLGLLPRSATPDARRARLAEVNARISRLDGQQGVTYLDLGAKFLNPDGSIPQALMDDYLHPTAKGYAVFADAIEPTLTRLLGE